MDRLIVRIEAMAKGDLASLSLNPGLTDLLKGMPEEERKKILTDGARVAGVFLQSAGSDSQPLTPTPEAIWKEIEKLALSMEENNVIFQVLDVILQPLTRVDEDLTETLRGELAGSLQPVERSVVPGDLLVEKGQTVTPQVAGILKIQGYSQVTFPWKQICFALLSIPSGPLDPIRRHSAPWRDRTSRGFTCPLYWVSAGWLNIFVHVQRPGHGQSVSCRRADLPPGLALPWC